MDLLLLTPTSAPRLIRHERPELLYGRGVQPQLARVEQRRARHGLARQVAEVDGEGCFTGGVVALDGDGSAESFKGLLAAPAGPLQL